MDDITGRGHSTEYVYHNGCYDTVERQFAGFEMTEGFHREDLVLGENETYQLPVRHVKSWFSVGSNLHFEDTRCVTKPIVRSTMPELNRDTAECLQALRGRILRTELYSKDATAKEHLPLETQEFSYDLKIVQEQGSEKYSVVQLNPKETLVRQYERDMTDARVSHEIILKTNDFGDVEERIRVIYPRTGETAFSEVNKNQKAGNMSYIRCAFTGPVIELQNFRKPAAWQQQEFEIFAFPLQGILDVEKTRQYDFGSLPDSKSTTPWKVLRSEQRAYYNDSLRTKRLLQGELEPFSLVDQIYSLAYDPDCVTEIEKGLRSCKVSTPVGELMAAGKYERLANDNNWWLPSSRAFFSDPADPLGSDLIEARKSFYNPTFFEDVFGNITHLQMDTNFLLAASMEDVVGNVMTFKNDYQRLQPIKIKDSDANPVQVVLDELGRTIAVASLGKGHGDERDVDSLEDFARMSSSSEADSVLLNPTGDLAQKLLRKSGSRTVYCSDQYQRWMEAQNVSQAKKGVAPSPITQLANYVLHISRAESFAASEKSALHVNVTYLDGLGRVMQEISLNEPDDVERTWLVREHSIQDHGGHAVQTYHPQYASSANPILKALTNAPATTLFHDAMGRQVASMTPDHLWTKTTYTPWTSTEYSTGDLILSTRPQDDPDVGHFFGKMHPSRYSQTWYNRRQIGTPQ